MSEAICYRMLRANEKLRADDEVGVPLFCPWERIPRVYVGLRVGRLGVGTYRRKVKPRKRHTYTLTGDERTDVFGWRNWRVIRDDGKDFWMRKHRVRALRCEGRLE